MNSSRIIITVFAIILTTFTLSFAGEVNRVEIGNMVLEDVPEIQLELKERLIQYQNVICL